MAAAEIPTNAAPLAFPDFGPLARSTEQDSKASQSAPDSTRRHSLPTQFLPPTLWSKNVSKASLVESEEAARGEHILDEASVAHRITALRQLNGATRSRHRYAKSTGAKNSTFSQPVIVRTYSGTVRPPSRQQNIITVRRENGPATRTASKMDLKLPPVEAFTFKGIMDEIRHGVSEDLERIAEICARSKYSLSNQYEVHMPPHGRGEPYLQSARHTLEPQISVVGPTLQAIGSDDEQSRSQGRTSRGTRRTRSAAYGTLETIMSSSRSSEEDKSKKKSAAELAEEVRGRAARKGSSIQLNGTNTSSEEITVQTRATRHVRSKSASFAAIVIETAHPPTQDTVPFQSQNSLISEPARPQTSTGSSSTSLAFSNRAASHGMATGQLHSSKPMSNSNRSAHLGALPTILESIGSWLPWNKTMDKTAANAEGSLRELLNSTSPVQRDQGHPAVS